MAILLALVLAAPIPVHVFLQNSEALPTMVTNGSLAECSHQCDLVIVQPGRVARRLAFVGETLHVWQTPEHVARSLNVSAVSIDAGSACSTNAWRPCNRSRPFQASERWTEPDLIAFHNTFDRPVRLLYVNQADACEESVAELEEFQVRQLYSTLGHVFRARDDVECLWEGAHRPVEVGLPRSDRVDATSVDAHGSVRPVIREDASGVVDATS